MSLSSTNCNAFYQTSAETASYANSVGTLDFTSYIEVEFDMQVTGTKWYWVCNYIKRTSD